MACLTHLRCTLVQQQDLWTLQHIFQTMFSDLMTCGLWSQSSQICVQLGLPLRVTFHVVKLMQVCLQVLAGCCLATVLCPPFPVSIPGGTLDRWTFCIGSQHCNKPLSGQGSCTQQVYLQEGGAEVAQQVRVGLGRQAAEATPASVAVMQRERWQVVARMGSPGAAGRAHTVPAVGTLCSTPAQPMAHLSRMALQDSRASQGSAAGGTRGLGAIAAAQAAVAAVTGWRSGYRYPTLRLSPHEL